MLYQSKCCVKPNELLPEQLSKIEEEHLKPGYFCSCGFMSRDDKLMEIYQTDLNMLENKNISFQQIADALTTIVEKYKRKSDLIGEMNIYNGAEFSPEIKKIHNEELLRLLQTDPEAFLLKVNGGYKNDSRASSTSPIIIDSKYLVTRISYWGFQPCPFICFSDRISRATEGGGDDYWIYDLETKKTLQFNDLLIHLIRDHHFFEGDVFHRLNPNDVIEFFNLQQEINYASDFVEVDRWVRLDEGGDISPCYKYGPTNEVDITRKDDNTVIIECTQRDISQKEVGYISPEERKAVAFDPEPLLKRLSLSKSELEYVFYELLIDGLPIRHRLDLKRVSTYEKKRVRYIPITEEKSLSNQYKDCVYTILPRKSYICTIIENGAVKTKMVDTDIFGATKIYIF